MAYDSGRTASVQLFIKTETYDDSEDILVPVFHPLADLQIKIAGVQFLVLVVVHSSGVKRAFSLPPLVIWSSFRRLLVAAIELGRNGFLPKPG